MVYLSKYKSHSFPRADNAVFAPSMCAPNWISPRALEEIYMGRQRITPRRSAVHSLLYCAGFEARDVASLPKIVAAYVKLLYVVDLRTIQISDDRDRCINVYWLRCYRMRHLYAVQVNTGGAGASRATRTIERGKICIVIISNQAGRLSACQSKRDVALMRIDWIQSR
ncbi:unnamed protein product, partial [Iphiclides podalirius]